MGRTMKQTNIGSLFSFCLEANKYILRKQREACKLKTHSLKRYQPCPLLHIFLMSQVPFQQRTPPGQKP